MSTLATLATVRRSWDSDAGTYLKAVEAADGQQLQTYIAQAINQFVLKLKGDGVWTLLKRSCILMGARTLTGALTPLVGSAPTNVNFVSGDYSSTTGLKGNGSTKRLNTGFGTSSLSSMSSTHLAISATSMETSAPANNGVLYIGTDTTGGNAAFDLLVANYSTFSNLRGLRMNPGSSYPVTGVSASGRGSEETLLIGTRTSSSLATLYGGGSSLATDTATRTLTSTSNAIFVYCTNNNGTAAAFSAMRCRFYSIGDGLTATQASNFTTAVSSLITALS